MLLTENLFVRLDTDMNDTLIKFHEVKHISVKAILLSLQPRTFIKMCIGSVQKCFISSYSYSYMNFWNSEYLLVIFYIVFQDSILSMFKKSFLSLVFLPFCVYLHGPFQGQYQQVKTDTNLWRESKKIFNILCIDLKHNNFLKTFRYLFL